MLMLFRFSAGMFIWDLGLEFVMCLPACLPDLPLPSCFKGTNFVTWIAGCKYATSLHLARKSARAISYSFGVEGMQ